MSNVVALLTDYGIDDGSAACLEAVVKKINPLANVIHISHTVPGWDISVAAMFLEVYNHYYPSGTVFVAVVDPGVGTVRSPIAIETDKYFFVGPDNGIFTRIIELEDVRTVVKLDNSNFWLGHLSTTFHGRDIFAPVGAFLSGGTKITSVGTPISLGDLVDLEPFVIKHDDKLVTRVLYVDRWGNMVIGVKRQQFENILDPDHPRFDMDINGVHVNNWVQTFAHIPEEELAMLFGGDFGDYGTVAMNMGNAALTCNAEIGTEVIIRKK